MSVAPTMGDLIVWCPTIQRMCNISTTTHLNTRGIEALRLDDAPPPEYPGINVERNSQGRGHWETLRGIGPFNVVARPAERRTTAPESSPHERAGSQACGSGPPEAYEPLFALHDRGQLDMRVAYRIPAMGVGLEAEWFRQVMAFRPSRHDDGQLAFLGLGENLVTGMNDAVRMGPGFDPSANERNELVRVARFAARRRVPLEIHAYTDDAASAILDVFENVAQEYDLRPLRWCIAHLNTGSRRTLERMERLGIAYTVQMGPYFEGDAIRNAFQRQQQ